MASVEQELFCIFTWYALHGNPLDPEHIRASQLVKLARDCQIVGSAMSEAEEPLTDADINVAFTAEVTRADKVARGHQGERNIAKTGPLRPAGPAASADRKKMNYNDFLTCLMKLSARVYPRSRTVDDAFQRLLMDNVLPLASRRVPDSVDMFLENEDVQRLFQYYADALEQIFAFYATADKRTHAALSSVSSASGAAFSGGTGLSHTGRSPVRATKAVNSMKEALGYAEFLRFASDFDLSNSVILSTIELGDVYLSSIKAMQPDSTVRKLSFMEFWEALVRCALVAYSKISDATILDKLRGLFLYMWRAINKSVPRAWADSRRHTSTNAGDLLSGAMLFNKRFTAAWAADGHRDYLSPQTRVPESGKTVLGRLLANSNSSRALGTAATSSMMTASAVAGAGGGNLNAGALAAASMGAGGGGAASAAPAYSSAPAAYGGAAGGSAHSGGYGYGGAAAYGADSYGQQSLQQQQQQQQQQGRGPAAYGAGGGSDYLAPDSYGY